MSATGWPSALAAILGGAYYPSAAFSPPNTGILRGHVVAARAVIVTADGDGTAHIISRGSLRMAA